jgi:beta-glucanase (GH16 family)
VATGEEWMMVFADEFDRTDLGDMWRTCHWWQTDGGCTIVTNNELEWYRPEAVSLSEGTLVLTAEAIEQRTTDGGTLPYRSGMVTTGPRASRGDQASSFAFTYGFVEARVRMPVGAGLWPAIWMLSADKQSVPEIDIMEWYGSQPTRVTMNVHQRVDGVKRQNRVVQYTTDMSGGWHVFGMRWTSAAVVFYMDGAEVGRVDDPALVPNSPMYLLLNLAVGGGQAGTPDPAVFPATFAVDYVRVWQPIGGT